ncbi:hypothetical protein B0H66DRAFT_565797 [Apodospora peruviana]|uniref:Uncharacterized protein n=1 Tax=Apodospora peruviana TaxID=516989 RepID=A0AAE0HUS4_9PEZI|nr:hypothetical protein B0H66DRAFT_565797 [Apodospora peruviana]
MDWTRDNAGVNDKDMDTVFKYQEKFTTVVRILESDAKPLIWTLETEEDWNDWMDLECPRIDDSPSGLTLILARRAGEPSFGGLKKARTDEWLERIATTLPGRTRPERAMTFASLNEKDETAPLPAVTGGGGRRSLRTLPFSKPTFRLITERFCTHGSIARAVSRANIPVFSSAEVQMGEFPAYVTNCRTTDAWQMDLALTCTYFPHSGLTFAIAFGCSLAVEEEILKRLQFATREAAHPLLMPGIIAELERARHVHVVEHTIDELETRIFEIDFKVSDMDGIADSETERRNYEKRNSWLDTAYLRNQLISWNTQLAKMAAQSDELKDRLFVKQPEGEGKDVDDDDDKSDTSRRPRSIGGMASVERNREQDNSRQFLAVGNPVEMEERKRQRARSRERVDSKRVELATGPLAESRHERSSSISVPYPKVEFAKPGADGEKQPTPTETRPSFKDNPEDFKSHMRRVGEKIKDRVQSIVDEYDDKIRDCTMRVDGMAMATQWADGESNVQIALEMRRDSRHMRSIALVTMVFLPGTFFASIFSMTFFNWSPGGGASDGPNNTSDDVVSSWLWIYVLFTVCATAATVFSWWYFVVYRHSRVWKLKKGKGSTDNGEESIPLV